MKAKNRHTLKKAIGEMPTFKLEVLNFWERIDNQLNKKNYTQYGDLISDLPEYAAPDGLWERVEYKLNKRQNNRQLKSLHFLTRVAAAAIIVVSIGFGLIYIKHNFTFESIHESGAIKKIKTTTKDELDVISIWNPALCQGNPQICNTDLFKALDKQLNEVKRELNLMESMIRKDDPQMMKYYYRLVNLRVEIEKKMVKIIMES
jgi:hypothetical protein